MKLNYAGIVGGILAFVSIALPWWYISSTTTFQGTSTTSTLSWYTWGLSPSGNAGNLGLWAGYTAMALVVIGGILALAGSVLTISRARLMLLGGGVLDLLSLVVFILGFNSIPSGGTCGGYGIIFCNQSGSFNGLSGSISSYLTYGYWIALVGGILSIAAIKTMGMGGGPKAAPAPSTPSM